MITEEEVDNSLVLMLHSLEQSFVACCLFVMDASGRYWEHERISGSMGGWEDIVRPTNSFLSQNISFPLDGLGRILAVY